MTKPAAKPYPRYCVECGNESVQPAQIAHNAQVKHDGKLHEFSISTLNIDKCQHCGEEYFTAETDQAISKGLRSHLRFLQPEEISARLAELELTQSEFANRLGVAKETVSRWITSHTIQNRAMDNLMRLFLGRSEVRRALTESGPTEGLGQAQRKTVNRLSTASSQSLLWVESRDFSASTLHRRQTFQLTLN